MPYTQEQSSPLNVSFNHINVQVFQLLEDLQSGGNLTMPRGFKCLGANLATLEIDSLYPIMNFEPRKFNFRYYAGELAWYLKANPSIEFISKFSSFWKDVCPDGKANSNYGDLLFNIHPSTATDDSEFGGGKIQLEWVYNSLVKDKDSRQAVAFFNAPCFQYEGNTDFVCTMYINFFINKNCLDMKVQMRSNDIFFGLTYDAPWFSTVHQSMFLNLKKVYPELKLGMYYHCADNIHYYERHFPLVEKIMDSSLESSIKLELIHPLFTFDEGKAEISKQSIKYLKLIDYAVANDMKDEQYFKNALSHLYTITEL